MAIHAAMIHRMDLEIGLVIDQIKAMGEWENTLVLFLSYNGASAEIMVRDDGHDPSQAAGSAGTYLCLGPGWSTVSNTPFRRHKTWTHEGGIATPLLLSWPAWIPARGEIRATPGHVIDVVPTLLELAGAKAASAAPAAPGKSLVATFASDQPTREEPIWWFHDGHKAIRSGNWKAVAPVGEPWELYDLANYRAESLDLAIPRADQLAELVLQWEKKLAEFTELAGADLPADAMTKAPAGKGKGQKAGNPPRKQVLINGETFDLAGRRAFRMVPEKAAADPATKPWIFYGPTLNAYPRSGRELDASAVHRRGHRDRRSRCRRSLRQSRRLPVVRSALSENGRRRLFNAARPPRSQPRRTVGEQLGHRPSRACRRDRGHLSRL